MYKVNNYLYSSGGTKLIMILSILYMYMQIVVIIIQCYSEYTALHT